MWQLSDRATIIVGDETIEVLRRRQDHLASIVYVDGKPVHRDRLKFRIRANVQPLSGKDLKVLPEGETLQDQYWVWCMPRPYRLTAGDEFLYRGDAYVVHTAEDWQSYVRARAVRVDTGPNRAADFELRPGQG